MAIIQPFKALRPQPQFAKQVASKPYDVLSSAEAKIEAQGNPASFLHITKSEIDLPEQIDVHAPEVYLQAKQNLDAFLKREILFHESKPCYYIYRLIMDGKSQTGLVCTSAVDDYDNNIIKKHEFTRPDKEQDRINHITVTGAQTGNVFLAYRNVDAIDAFITQWTTAKTPGYDFVADDAVQHSIWVINDGDAIETITNLFAKHVPVTYIADGHHRAASAAKVRQSFNGKIPEAANYFLTTLFPANQLSIMDYNRVISDLNGHTQESLLAALSKKFTVHLVGEKALKPAASHEMGMYLNGNWYQLTAKPGSFNTDPIGILDISILQKNILEPIFNIVDQRTDKRIDFVGGIRGMAALESRVNSGEMKVAFSLFPVSMEQLFTIADTNNVMPPKSTWFEPKLRDGLLTHLIYE